MASTVQGLAYQAFGLQIFSEFPLPELPLAEEPGLNGSVAVIRGELAARWEAIPKITPSVGVLGREVMFEVKGKAVFSVQDGIRITVDPAAGADMDSVRLYILGSCMGVLLMQKQILPLHGSALVPQPGLCACRPIRSGQIYACLLLDGAGSSDAQ